MNKSTEFKIFGIYLKELNKKKYAQMDDEEIGKLLKRYRGGRDYDAGEKLINSIQKLICSLSKKFREDGLTRLDYIQEGNMCLFGVIDDGKEGYDSQQNRTTFRTYSKMKINWAMLDARRREMAEKPNRPEEKGYGTTLKKMLEKEDIVERIFRKELPFKINAILQKEIKSKRDRKIIKFIAREHLVFKRGSPGYMTFEEIGKKFKLSSKQIQRLFNGYIETLKESPELRKIYDELD